MSVLGNTTCPADEIAMTDNHRKELVGMLRHYDGVTFGFQMCPPTLFAEIIKINHLRVQAAKGGDRDALSTEARETRERIEKYSPTQWAISKPAATDCWLALGTIYKSATAMYCILSLQSSSLLPRNKTLRNCCCAHAQQLRCFLEGTMSNLGVKRFLLWPLIVLGVEASHGDATLRILIEKQLMDLSCFLGSHVPLAAKSVLQRFWVSQEMSWDGCFDRPYAFATQIAVDLSQISPN
jgi:hypothetical protein